MAPWAEVRDSLNRLVRGWTAYFSYGSCTLAYRALEHHIWHRVHYFLRRRHKADRDLRDQPPQSHAPSRRLGNKVK
jgi:RNA-directed DNA polymerase